MDRLPFQSFGPGAYTPDGVLYGQFPDDMWGELSKRAQYVLRALLQVWDGRTLTDISRKDLKEVVNELRAAKKVGPIISLRSITWYLSELVRLGIIARERISGSNIWYTRLARPFYTRLNDSDATPPPTPSPTPPPAASQIDDGTVRWAIEFTERKGWRIVLGENGQLDREPIPGREQEDLPEHFRVLIRTKYREAIIAYLRRNHPLRE